MQNRVLKPINLVNTTSASVATPSSGSVALFLEGDKIKIKDDTGTVFDYVTGGGTATGTNTGDNAANTNSGLVHTTGNETIGGIKTFTSGVKMSGELVIGQTNIASGNLANGKSIVLGDSDTGFRQNGDGVLDIYCNNDKIATLTTTSAAFDKPLRVTADPVDNNDLCRKSYVNSATVTLTNKRITERVNTITSSATPTPTGDTTDMFTITALAVNAAIAAPTGTPTDGQVLLIRIKDNATARTLTWNAIYRASTDLTLPTTTVLSKTLYLQFMYNSADSKFDLVGLLNNF